MIRAARKGFSSFLIKANSYALLGRNCSLAPGGYNGAHSRGSKAVFSKGYSTLSLWAEARGSFMGGLLKKANSRVVNGGSNGLLGCRGFTSCREALCQEGGSGEGPGDGAKGTKLIMPFKSDTESKAKSHEIGEKLKEVLEDAMGIETINLKLEGLKNVIYPANNFVITTGRSARHMRVLVDETVDTIKSGELGEFSKKDLIVDSYDVPNTGWMIVKVPGVTVHVFEEETRKFVNLESLWTKGYNDSAMKELQAEDDEFWGSRKKK
eukprot:Nk52_evm17s2496 gene=Nk52_evmTU17s2496